MDDMMSMALDELLRKVQLSHDVALSISKLECRWCDLPPE